uniref:Subtilisin n=1 Tax=Noctiluca scintillans TaxID=2966 RepID=A0A7S1F3L1_NOCSC|mmetsp:Transcript_30960/g.82226  ORF Transcript_30960/g.82226 Transcript_30960/m.82226 type:complete len:258 (+) Transcript_30960:66-839(+)|eukprot:CAMPEP_0194503358 /NCGR_PEP_ID=MMETSP0253-20130528/28339_1 /TAXON_ID=2966 /ORGANISM="Noctiluca scintillans" /LENGTH=257 /DNA_ID=CAMNT_0039345635 /DNA_START=57 /DNA_END=830 /DNA_ORIENTATION=-
MTGTFLTSCVVFSFMVLASVSPERDCRPDTEDISLLQNNGGRLTSVRKLDATPEVQVVHITPAFNSEQSSPASYFTVNVSSGIPGTYENYAGEVVESCADVDVTYDGALRSVTMCNPNGDPYPEGSYVCHGIPPQQGTLVDTRCTLVPSGMDTVLAIIPSTSAIEPDTSVAQHVADMALPRNVVTLGACPRRRVLVRHHSILSAARSLVEHQLLTSSNALDSDKAHLCAMQLLQSSDEDRECRFTSRSDDDDDYRRS